MDQLPSKVKICAFHPQIGSAGDWIHLTGENFKPPVSIVCGDGPNCAVVDTVVIDSLTEARFIVPLDVPGQFNITMLTADGMCQTAEKFVVGRPGSPPTILEVESRCLYPGKPMWIKGLDFDTSSMCATIGNSTHPIEVSDSTLASLPVPAVANVTEPTTFELTVESQYGISNVLEITIMPGDELKDSFSQSLLKEGSASSSCFQATSSSSNEGASAINKEDSDAMQVDSDEERCAHIPSGTTDCNYVVAYEAERYIPFKGWSGQNLIPYTTDPYPWADGAGNQIASNEAIKYPPFGCEWNGSWALNWIPSGTERNLLKASVTKEDENCEMTVDEKGKHEKHGKVVGEQEQENGKQGTSPSRGEGKKPDEGDESDSWQYASIRLAFSEWNWYPYPFGTATLRRREWRRAYKRLQDITEEQQKLFEGALKVIEQGRNLIAQGSALVKKGDAKGAERTIQTLQKHMETLSSSKVIMLPQTQDFMIECRKQVQRADRGGDIERLSTTSEAQDMIQKAMKTLNNARYYYQKREGTACSKYIDELQEQAQPLITEERFLGLDNVSKFMVEYEEVIAYDVDTLIKEKRASEKVKDYTSMWDAIRKSLDKKQAGKAQEQWQVIKDFISSLEDGGADHDLAMHGHIQEILWQYGQQGNEVFEQIQMLLREKQAENYVAPCRSQLQQLKKVVDQKNGLKAQKIWDDITSKLDLLSSKEKGLQDTEMAKCFMADFSELQSQLRLNCHHAGTGKLPATLLTCEDIWLEHQRAFALQEIDARKMIVEEEVRRRKEMFWEHLHIIHGNTGAAFKIVDSKLLFTTDTGRHDKQLGRATPLAMLCAMAVYQEDPSLWLEEHSPGLGDWIVLREVLREDCCLFQGPQDVWILACRGSTCNQDFLDDFKIHQVDQFGCKIHAGFYERADAIPLDRLRQLLRSGKHLLLTGHSLGGAIASIATLKLLDLRSVTSLDTECINRTVCVTFGMPLLGDEKLSNMVRKHHYSFCHFVYNGDIVPRSLVVKNRVQSAMTEKLSYHVPRLTQTAFTAAAGTNAYVAGLAGVAGIAAPFVADFFLDKQFRPYKPFGTYFFVYHDVEWEGMDEIVRVQNPRTILQLLDDGSTSFEDHKMENYWSAFEYLKRKLTTSASMDRSTLNEWGDIPAKRPLPLSWVMEGDKGKGKRAKESSPGHGPDAEY